MVTRILYEFSEIIIKLMKKVLIVVPSLGIGGQERIAVNMAKCLKVNYDVKIVVFQNKIHEYEADCEVINLNVPTSNDKIKKLFGQLKRARKLKKIIKQEKADVVFSLGATANLTNALARRGVKSKAILAVHGFAEVKRSAINSFMFKRADAVVTISQDMQYSLSKLYPKIKRSAVIENGYEISKEEAPRILKFDPEKPRFASMGRLEFVKGFDRLIKVFAGILEKIPEARLTIIGDGSERVALEDEAKSLGIADKIEFTGYNSNPLSVLRENDVYLLTSRNEGFPNCLIEAMSCGLAVIAVDCLSGPKEILSEQYLPERVKGINFEKYGVLVENCDDEDVLIQNVVKAVLELVHDKEKFCYYKKIGLSRAEDFSLSVFEGKLRGLIESIS